MKSTLFRETNILLGYVKTLLVYTCVVIVDKFYCRQQYFQLFRHWRHYIFQNSTVPPPLLFLCTVDGLGRVNLKFRVRWADRHVHCAGSSGIEMEARSQVCRKLNSTGCSVYVQLGGNIPPPFFPFHKIFLCFLDRKGKECTHTVCKLSRWIIQYSTAQPSSVIVLPFSHIFLILFLKG